MEAAQAKRDVGRGSAITTDDKSAPYTVKISGKRLKPGSHRLKIVTTDKNGNVTTTTKSIDGCGRTAARVTPKFTG